MRLIITDAYTSVEEIPLSARKKLTELLSARPSGYQFSPKFKRGQWDGWVSLFRQGKFPTGLLPDVLNVLANEDELELELLDKRAPLIHSEPVEHLQNGYTLRPYQYETVEAILKAGHGTIKLATNAGKTLVAASLWLTLGKPTAVYVVPSVALLEQTSAELEEYTGQTIGKLGGGSSDYRRLTVVVTNSLPKFLKSNFSPTELVIIDECHRTKSATIFDNIFKLPGRYRIGMSGTPLTYNVLSDMKLVAATGPVIYEITNEAMTAKGYSVPPNIQFIKLTEEWDKELKYPDAYRQHIVNSVIRNLRIADLAMRYAKSTSVLIIANWIEHTEAIAEFLDDVIYLTGQNSKQEMLDGLGLFKTEGGIMLCTPIFGEGVNVPDVGVIILAGGGKSYIQLLQRIGRGMRTAEEKTEVIIIDFIDDTNKFLFTHSEVRYALYKQEGFTVSMYAD